MQKAPEYHAFAADFCLNIFVFYTIERAGGAERVFHRAAGAISHGGFAAVFHCEAKNGPERGLFLFYGYIRRLCRRVISRLRRGYVRP